MGKYFIDVRMRKVANAPMLLRPIGHVHAFCNLSINQSVDWFWVQSVGFLLAPWFDAAAVAGGRLLTITLLLAIPDGAPDDGTTVRG